MKRIVSIIVTYNRKELLKESLEALFSQTYSNFDIFIIDNASTDGTKEYIEQFINKERVIYFNTGKNLGGAGGFNYGIKAAVTSNYDKIWIMDDDTIPSETALEELMIADQKLNEQYGFLCSDVKWIDGNPCVMNVPNITNKWIEDSKFIREGLLRVEQCSFVSCFLQSSVIREVGLPIRDFFVWGDDAEYTKRISTKLPSYFVSKSLVVHKIHSNIPTDISQDSPDRLFRYQYSYRNMYYVNKAQGSKLSMLLFLYGVYVDVKKVLKSNKKGKCKKIRIIFRSLTAGIKFKPKVEYVEN